MWGVTSINGESGAVACYKLNKIKVFLQTIITVGSSDFEVLLQVWFGSATFAGADNEGFLMYFCL